MPVVEIRQLVKQFGAVTAVDRLTFDVEAGTVTGFLGPNGAGKTTTLRTLLGLVSATSGEALIEGQPYRELVDPVNAVGAVLEASAFYPGRSGREHLRVLATAAGISFARVDELLGLVALADDAGRKVGKYSLGMRQRLHLAAALLGDPRVLILDEPANGLDPAGIVWLRSLLRYLADNDGKTVLVSSHVLSEVAQTVDDVVIISHGRLVAHAPIGVLLGRTAARVRVRSPEINRLAEVLRTAGLAVELDPSDVLWLSDSTTDEIGRIAFEAGLPLSELSPEVTNLEAVFLELTEDQAVPA